MVRSLVVAVPLAVFGAAASASNSTAPTVVGFVMRSSATTISGAPSRVGQTVLGGDTFQVGNGAAEIAIGESKIILGKNTQVSFKQEPSGMATVLDRGNLTFSRTKDAPGLRVRIGEIVVAPTPGRNSRGVITVTNQALMIAASEGSLLVDANGEQMGVPQGTAIRLIPNQVTGLPQTAGSPQAPAPTTPSGSINWGRVATCFTSGAAVSTVPAIVKDQTASATSDWDWGLIPVGAINSGLVCSILPNHPKNPGISCTLTALQQQDWGAQPQLSYTSTNADQLALAPPQAPPGNPPQPPNGNVTVSQNGTYTMTATGPGGVATCKARVDWSPPTCNISANPKTGNAGAPVTLNWSSMNSIAPVQLSWSNSVTNGADPKPSNGSMVVNPTQGTNYTLTVKGPGGTRKCSVWIAVRPPPPPPPPPPDCTQQIIGLVAAFRSAWGVQNVNLVASVLSVANLPGTAATLLGLAGKAPVATVAASTATGGVAGATPVLPPMVTTSLSGAVATFIANKVLPLSFGDACSKVALCAVKNGHRSATINFCNAIGNQVARCSWTTDAQGNVTVGTQWWGWRYRVFDTWGGPPGCDFQLGR